MPAKTWDTQADFQGGTFSNCEASADGKIVLSSGQSSGVWTSPVYEAVDWQHWSQLGILGVRPTGTNVYYRFRSAATAEACVAAPWSPYTDDMDADGRIDRSLRIYYLNNPTASVGAYMQVEITLEAS